jgi:hypothetical protein
LYGVFLHGRRNGHEDGTEGDKDGKAHHDPDKVRSAINHILVVYV